MSKLSKLKLNRLSNAEFNERELHQLLGGGTHGNC
ncbi:MAG: TIGR04149 family rSAM-modified RiPP [Paludibacter sp.]|nr:TIGR04149 family rSAM-modified RiPP [Paludibacter sp.]